jgi:hypothetical protein
MGEDRSAGMRLSAPVELSRNGRMTDQTPISCAPSNVVSLRAIADIDADAVQRFRRAWKPGDVRRVERSFSVGRYAISDAGARNELLNWIGLKPEPSNCHRSFQWHFSSVKNGKATQQA